MADVYRAEQDLGGGIVRPAALKVIRPEHAATEQFREMFLDEARIASGLSHPNLVHIYDVGEVDGLLYLAMELIVGETLASVARALESQNNWLPSDALVAIGIFTLYALEAVHALRLPSGQSAGLVHRDVSPNNLVLTPSGALKLIDFGIAKAAHNRNLTLPGMTKGKMGYFSPEQALGLPLDGRSDLFSLGVTLYKLASGVTPLDRFQGHLARSQALVSGSFAPLEAERSDLVPGFYRVVARALAVKPSDRFASATAMREALEQVALDAGISIGPSTLAGYVRSTGAPQSAPRVGVGVGVVRRSVRRITTRLFEAPSDPRARLRLLLTTAVAALVGAAIPSAFLWIRGPEDVAVRPLPEHRTLREVVAAAAEPPAPAIEPPPRRARRQRSEVPLVQQGRLRVLATGAARAQVAAEPWTALPVEWQLAPARYEVSFATLEGKRLRCAVEVVAGRTTSLLYNVGRGACGRAESGRPGR